MPEAVEGQPTPAAPSRARLWPLVAAALIGLLAGDSARPAETQWGARAAIAVIDGYRAVVSPLLGRTGLIRCKFTPTCSAYAREALKRFGTIRGAALGTGRLLRCHPFAKGGADPVPSASLARDLPSAPARDSGITLDRAPDPAPRSASR